jgi:hypothetical protein
VSYVYKQFFGTGSELFSSLPQSKDEVPKVTNVLYTVSSERKDSPGVGVSIFLIFYLIVVSIVAIWRATRAMEKKRKKIVLRLSSFVLGPIIGIILGMAFLLGPTLGFYSLAQVIILQKAGAAADRIVEGLKIEKEREKMGIISDEEVILEKVRTNPLAPALINDDDSFTNNLIIAVATIGKNKTAFESVAIPQALYRKNRGNALINELDTDILLLPGHVLAVRNLTPDFGTKLLPVLGEKIIRQNKLIRAKITESGKGAPKYIFLTTDGYRKLRAEQDRKNQKRYIDTIALIKGRLSRGEGNRVLLLQRLEEWESAYQNYLSHPVGVFNELGTATADSVQVLLVDEENIPSDITGFARYFLSPLTTTIHELIHYYSNNKDNLPDAVEESVTSYYEINLTQGVKILMDSSLSIEDFAGYPEEKKVIDEVAKGVSDGDLANLYFSGNQARFSRVFEQKYSISYEDFIERLDKIFYAASAEESEKLREELLSKLKEGNK